ncbi:hypothetical protein ACIQFU_37150 [Streptomyces sp. NPDC093065]|uniref:hypothetical protein n=1 Tax=Streptomyces sp. NPDC093065 TaxID=3366021 RepID=UPI003804052A
MTTDEHARWKALEVRRPGDVPAATPLAWQLDKHGEHEDRLMNNRLPEHYPHPVQRGDADDALAVIALRESIRRDMEHGRGVRVLEAMELGASWSEVAAALDVPPDEARLLLHEWAEGQHRLYQGDVAKGQRRPPGLDDDRHAVVLALCELGDDESAAVLGMPVPEGRKRPGPAADYNEWKAADLLEEVRVLAVAVVNGQAEHAPNLAEAARTLQYRYDWPQRQGPSSIRATSGFRDVDLMRRVTFESNGFLAVTAGEIRRAMGRKSLAGFNLCTVPAELPADDEAPVCLYNGLAGVGSLLGTLARGEDATAALEAVEDRAVHNRPHPTEY